MDFRQKIFHFRSFIPLPFLLIAVLLGHPTSVSVNSGIVVAGIGEFLRLWGVAIAGSETRTTGPVGGSQLITRGPFAYVRNPLYLGNIIIYTSIGIMANIVWLPLMGIAFFVLQYRLIASLEEEHLQKQFGDEYAKYYQSVPRFIPAMKKYNDGNGAYPQFNWTRGIRSERSSLLAIILVTGLFAVIARLRG